MSDSISPTPSLGVTVLATKNRVTALERDVKDLTTAIEQLYAALQIVADSQAKPKFGVPMPATESSSFKRAIADADMYLDRVKQRSNPGTR